ncbi:hypothetical protein GUJ93_ZPchr0012g21414 [Zizania palustris]|uniref:Uncharacterized protein n=1 Tax=Zizania palustris TaxID=103762 RepID=A0A8J6BQY6_ZIZPA|nr:hypothetical protein GUJ93_ZPchr0012g21414 [Zizania palustris]
MFLGVVFFRAAVFVCPRPSQPPAPAVVGPREALLIRLVSKGVILEVDQVERVRRESKVAGEILAGGVRGGSEVALEAVGMVLEDVDEAAALSRLSLCGVVRRAIGVLERSHQLSKIS